jgi:signal transduction histidine kinase
LEELCQLLVTKLRNITLNLHSNPVKQFGLTKVIHNTLNQIASYKQFKVEFEILGTEYRLASDQEIIIYRICQELITNATKHAKASVLRVELNYRNDLLVIKISDDGKGFDLSQSELKGMGLTNIYTRSKIIGRELSIHSVIGKGTSITINIPNKNLISN